MWRNDYVAQNLVSVDMDFDICLSVCMSVCMGKREGEMITKDILANDQIKSDHINQRNVGMNAAVWIKTF